MITIFSKTNLQQSQTSLQINLHPRSTRLSCSNPPSQVLKQIPSLQTNPKLTTKMTTMEITSPLQMP
jgi:hypothetical protein